MKELIFIIILIFSNTVNGSPGTRESASNEHWTMLPDEDENLHLINRNGLETDEAILLPRTTVQVNFYLFTQHNPTVGKIIFANDEVLLFESNFDPSFPTRIITHGWRNNGSSPVNTLIRTAYLARDNFNIIVADWGDYANFNYYSSRSAVPEVGVQIAELVDFLVNSGGMSTQTLTLIGHSLGAHASGIAGKNIKTGNVNTLIAMDPAMPLFYLNNPEDRLDVTDAEYVEVIHTNMGTLGFQEHIGHTSFYANWGHKQPGCGSDTAGVCSHSRSYMYFAESLSEANNFIAVRCKNYEEIYYKTCEYYDSMIVKMGGEPSNHGKVSGIFYVPTNDHSPFGMGNTVH